MVHVTIEYMIMLPILILQIFLFPLTASWLMNVWVDSRRTLAIQDVASHLGSTIQQLYFSLKHKTIAAGVEVTYAPGLPPYIEDCPYVASATLRAVSSQENASQVLDLTVKLVSTKNSVTSMVILGTDVVWEESIFASNSTSACVSATKLDFPNGTIVIKIWFGG